MELNNLPTFVIFLVAVGMLLGVGILTIDKFSASTYYTRSDYNDTITLSSNMTNVKLDYGNVTVSAVWNGTAGTFPASCYIIDSVEGNFNFTNTSDSCDVLTQTSYLVYDWKDYTTETRNALTSVSTEISNIPTSWLGLLVTIVVLSVILLLVIRSFGAPR